MVTDDGSIGAKGDLGEPGEPGEDGNPGGVGPKGRKGNIYKKNMYVSFLYDCVQCTTTSRNYINKNWSGYYIQ